jgi:hypothetical protein
MTTKMRMWKITDDGCLEGVVPAWYKNPTHCIRNVGAEKTIKTSKIKDSHVTAEGLTVVVTESGSRFELTGHPRLGWSRSILIAQANHKG